MGRRFAWVRGLRERRGWRHQLGGHSPRHSGNPGLGWPSVDQARPSTRPWRRTGSRTLTGLMQWLAIPGRPRQEQHRAQRADGRIRLRRCGARWSPRRILDRLRREAPRPWPRARRLSVANSRRPRLTASHGPCCGLAVDACATKGEIGHSGHSIDAYQTRSTCIHRCTDMPVQQFFIFSQPTLLQNRPAVMAARQPLCAPQQMRARTAFKCGHDPVREIALIPHKQAISIQ
jgi:hypothetical protein